AETGIDRAGQSVVSAALAMGASRVGDLAGRPAVVIGAGAMGSLALASLHRLPAGELAVANRSQDRAERLAAKYGATGYGMADVPTLLRTADVVVSAT